jgi:hypothetical protein
MEMKCILNIGKKYFYIYQGYSGERCGPWASCYGCDQSYLALVNTKHASVHMQTHTMVYMYDYKHDYSQNVCHIPNTLGTEFLIALQLCV